MSGTIRRCASPLLALLACASVSRAVLAGAAPEGIDAYRRGDADCSNTHSAADVTTTARAIAGLTACGNADCDRDGVLGAADVECAARCLFGSCAVAPGAPAIEEVLPGTAPQIQSFATIRIRGTRFGPVERLKAVSIGGEIADVVEYVGPDEILAVVPELLPGVHELVVRDGELESAPFPLLIEPGERIGDVDTFADLIALVDDVVAALAEVDLAAAGVHADDVAVLRREIADFRADLPGLVDDVFASAELPNQLRLRLDLITDLSGAPEALRDALAQLQALEAPTGSRGASAPVIGATVQVAARAVGTAARTVIAAARVGTIATLGTEIVIIAGVATAVTVVIGSGEAILVDVPFIDEIPPYLRPGEEITIVGRGFGTVPPNPDLVVRTRDGEITVRAERSGSTADGREFLVYEVPTASGLCGANLEIYLTRRVLLLARSSPPVPASVQPVLLEVGPFEASLGERVGVTARGVVGCEQLLQTVARFRRASSGAAVASDGLLSPTTRPLEVDTAARSGIVPDVYDVSVVVQGIESDEHMDIVLHSDLTGLDIRCEATQFAVGSSMLCRALPQPTTASLPLQRETVVYRWSAKPNGEEPFDHVAIQSQAANAVTLVGVSPGMDPLSVRLESDRQAFIAQSDDPGISVRVVDDSAPSVTITSSADEVITPPRDLRIAVRATDDVGVRRLVLRTTGDAVDPAARQQMFACTGATVCTHTFDVPVLGSGFTDLEIVLDATAFDAADNEGRATFRHQLRVTALGGTIRSATDSSPLEGADVRLLNDQRHFLVGARSDADGRFVVMDPGEAAILNVVLDGFAPAELDLTGSEGRAAAALDIDIALTPIDGQVAVLSGTTRVENQFGAPVPSTSVTVVDREGRIAGFDVSDVDGAYEIGGLPVDDYLIFGDAPGKARVSSHVQLSRFGSTLVIPLQIPNPVCRNDLTLFEPVQGYSASGRQTVFGEATFAGPNVGGIQDPAATFLCLSGSQAAPLIAWDDVTAARSVRRLIVREEASGGAILFDVFARSGETLQQPITFGDYSVGVANGPEPAGVLHPNVDYTVIISETGGLSALQMVFRLR